MASPERVVDDEPENDVIPDEQSSWHDSRSIYSDEQSSISGAAPNRSRDSQSVIDDEGSHRSGGSQSERSYRSGEASYRSGDSRSFEDGGSRSFEDGDLRSFEDGDLRSFEDDEGSRRSQRSHSSDDGSHSRGEARSFAEDAESFRSQGSHSQESPRSREGSHRSGSSRSRADGDGSFRSQGWSRSSRGEESKRIGESSSFLEESGHQSGGSRSFQDETSFRSDRSEEYRSDHDRSEGGQSIGGEPFDSQDNSDYSDDDGVESLGGDSPQHSQHSQASDESSSADSEVPSFAEDSEVSPIASPTKSVPASSSAANGSDPFGNQVSDDEGDSHAFGGSGFSNNPFDIDEAGAAFGTFENGGLESTEIDRDFAGDVFGSSAMDGLGPSGSGAATGNDPFAAEFFGSFGSGVDTGNDPFAAAFLDDNAFGAVALDAATNDSQSGNSIVDDEQAIDNSSRGSQPDIPAAETKSSSINVFGASPLPSASIQGDGTPGFDDVFGNDEFDASFTNGEGEFKSSAFVNGSFDEKFGNDDAIKIDASFVAEGFGAFPAESQIFVESDDGGGAKSQTAGPLETTHLEGSFASGSPQREESQSPHENESPRGSQSGASGESRSFDEGEGSYHSSEQSYHSSESRSSEEDNNSFGPQHDESRGSGDSKFEGKHQIEHSHRSRGSEYTDQDSASSFGEDGSFEASENAPQHDFTVNDPDIYQTNSFHSDSRSPGEKSDGSTSEDRSVEVTNSVVHSEGNLQDSFETGLQSDEKSFYSDDDQSQEASVKDEPQQDEESAYSKDTNEGGTKLSAGPSEHSGEVEDEETEDKGERSFDSGSYESSGPSFAEEESGHVSDVDYSRDDQARSNTPDIESSQTDDNELAKGDAEDDDDESIGIGDVFGQPNELFEQHATSEKVEGQRTRSQKARSESIDKRNDSSPQGSAKNETSAPDNVQGSLVKPEPKPKLYPKPKDKEDPEERRRRKKRKKKLQKAAKSDALLALVSNVNEAMLELEAIEAEQPDFEETSAHRLLHGFDALLGIYLQLSDELELLSTFAQAKKRKEREAMVPLQALKAVLSFAATLDELFADLQPIILDCFEEDPDEEMDDMLYRLNSLVDLLCETTHRVGERQEWNERAETTYVTLLELMEREATELISYFEDVETPEQILSANIHEAWSATGHIEELRALQYASDPWLFRQLCYEVMVSTDQWCPDTTILMEICGIDPSLLEEEPDSEYLAEEELAPIPQAAEHVLDKVNGEPLSRTTTLASILRRILPPRAITDATLLDNFTSIRNTVRNPLGLSATNIVSISSIPEQPNDPDSLGVGGMGKTTLAAMVAQHPDVRRYFIDGVVWVYVGDKELNYNRYTQCLRELVAQLDFYRGVPLFAELLHVPGEALSKRRRREEGFMIYARDTIAEILHDRSVLIILDDVCFEPDLDWFDFAPMPGEENDQLDSNCALLVTTRCRTLLPAADTVEVDMLDEADAISLLIQESGQLSHTLMAQSREARSVVRECANHPLAVKSVGRWLHLKHATAGVVSSVEEIHSEVIKSMDKILKGGDHTGTDMMYEILSMSLSPAINGEPTSIIKFCLAAFVIVFCDREYISDFALTEPTPIIPMDMAELLFETLLEMNESSLLQKGSLFYAQKKEAAVLIPEALSALGVLKVITYSDAEENEEPEDEQKFLQVMHFIHHEYGEYLCGEEEALKDLTKDAERQWNRALVEAYLSQVEEWDRDLEDAGHSYALEMIVSHMIRGGMSSAAADLLADKNFVRGRLLSLGRENATRRQIKDCEALFKKLKERRQKGSKLEPRTMMKQAYQALGSQLALGDEDSVVDSRIKDVEVARAHYEIGFSLAEKRCWDAAIAHWETSQGILVAALGTVEIVAGILFNIGVVYSEMNEYEQALDSLKQCLRIRGTIHGEEHILYAQTIQKIGDIFLGMSDYHEALESYNWALDVMYIDPNIHRVEIGEILDNKGTIHYSKGEIDEALQCHQEALRSKQFELGEDHPELASTYHHIGNCLSDQGNVDDAVVHFEEAIRLKELDPEGGPERDADVLTIEGILHNLEGNQDQGLECYEKSLQILVTKVPYRKEKVASLLHLIGCVYLMSGEQKKAMKLFEESLQARRKVLGFVHLDVASTLFNMAFLHQTRNRLDKALKCLEEALKIRQLRLPDSEKVAVTHEKIGSLARAIGKTKKAQINFEDALRIRRLIHGEQHEAVATVLQELGDLMDDLSEYDSAMSYYIDALDIRRNRLGLDDIAVAETLYSMGYTLHNNDEPDRALVCFEESLNIRRYQLGDDSKEVGDTLNMMGFLKAKRGELDDALTLLWDALRIRKIQEDHVKVSETLKNIGNVHREKKERDVAVECYEECLRIRRTELGPEHEKVADALIAMGNVQSDMDHKDDAMRSYQEALKIRTMLFGEHDEGVAAVLQYMGTMEFRSGNHDRARDLLTEFIRIRRDNGTKHDGDYVNVLFMIGNIHKMHNHEDDAQLCWSEAYQVFQELGLAETNPQIAKVMNHLLKAEEEKEEADKKKAKGAGVFGKVTEKLKANTKEEKLPGKKRRKGKGIQL